MDYRGQDLDLRTARWNAASTDPAGWREVPTSTATASAPPPRPVTGRSGPIWVDETLLSCANHAYDVALAYRSAEVRLEHLMLAMTRVEAAAADLEARGVRIASLRRDCAVSIAGELPASSEGNTPRRSHELEDVLRLAAARASHAGHPGTVEDVAQVLAEIGGDLPGGDLIARYFPRPVRDFWATSALARQPHPGGAHMLEGAEGERALGVVAAHPPTIDAGVVQGIFDRLAGIERALSERFVEIERAFAERIASIEAVLGRQPAPQALDLNPLESRLAAIESALQSRSAEGGVAAIDPALTDRLWAIETALGTERTERATAITTLSDEITGVRSAVRLAAQTGEEARAQFADQLQTLSAGLEQHRLDLASSLGDSIDGIKQSLDTYDQKTAEAQAVYGAELAEVHDALMKISANQHTLAGAIDHWRNNDSGEIHLINARIGAVHEDGAKRLSALEKLCADVETLSQLVLDERVQPRGTFKQWLYGTDDWMKASWRRAVGAGRTEKPQRGAWRLPFKRT